MTTDLLLDIPPERRRSLAQLRLGNVRTCLSDLESHRRGDDRFRRLAAETVGLDGLYRLWVDYVRFHLTDDELCRHCDREEVEIAISRARALGLEVNNGTKRGRPTDHPGHNRHERGAESPTL